MYFLEQIKVQFIQTLAAFQEAVAQGPVGGDENLVAANDNEAPNTDFRVVEGGRLSDGDQEILKKLEEQLSGIDGAGKIVSDECKVSGNFLEQVRDGKVDGCSPEDREFKELLAYYTRKYKELEGLRNEGQQIEHVLAKFNYDMLQVVKDGLEKGDITSEHLDEIGAIQEDTLKADLEMQEELQRLEKQRDGYDGVMKEILSHYSPEARNDFSPETQVFITQIEELIGSSKDPTKDGNEKIAQNLSVLANVLDVDGYKKGIRGVLAILPSERIPQDMKQQAEEFLKQNISLEDKEIGENTISDLRTQSAEGKEILEKLYSALALTEKEQEEYDTLQKAYGEKLGKIGEYLKDFIGKEENLPSMKEAMALYETLSQKSGKGLSYFERLQFLKSEEANIGHDNLHRLTDIAKRDQEEIEGKKLGNLRLDNAHAKYEEILKDTKIKEALSNDAGETPTFEELRIEEIMILQEKGVNLAELFLVDEEGKSVSGDLETGKSYIINLSSSTHLSGKLDFALLSTKFSDIVVDGEKMHFEKDHFDSENTLFSLKDGSKITLEKAFGDTEKENEARKDAVKERFDNIAMTSIQERLIDQALASPNPEEALKTGQLPGGLVGFFLAMVLNIGDGRNFQYDPETGTWIEREEGEPLTNADMATGGFGTFDVKNAKGIEEQPEGVKGLVGMIYQKESRGNPNAVYGGYKGPRPNLTDMTIREVRVFQDKMVASGCGSSAVGAPQIIRKTMDGAIRAGVFSPDEKFTPEAQNRFTLWKLNQRGLQAFKNGKIDEMDFMKRLSMEWASFPKDMNGRSYYAGDGMNKALISPQQVLHQIRKIR